MLNDPYLLTFVITLVLITILMTVSIYYLVALPFFLTYRVWKEEGRMLYFSWDGVPHKSDLEIECWKLCNRGRRISFMFLCLSSIASGYFFSSKLFYLVSFFLLGIVVVQIF